jgi:hypothetical protein
VVPGEADGRSERPTIYHNRLVNWMTWTIVALTALILLSNLVKVLERPHPSAAVAALEALVLAAFLIPALRYPRNGVVASSEQLVIRNIYRTHVLGWHEIDHFEMASYGAWPRIGVAVLKDGRRVPMTGIQSGLASRFATRTVAALNTRLGTVGG